MQDTGARGYGRTLPGMSRAELQAAGIRARTAVRAPLFWGRVLQFNLGLMLMGLGLALLLQAGIGLGPWAVFHEGLSLVSGLSFGRILQLVGVAVLGLSWWWTGERPGPGTFVNMLLVGPWVDLFAAQAWLPTAEGVAWGVAQFTAGTAIVGLASGLYITADLGAGPRDGFVLGLSRILRLSIRRSRGLLEFTVLVVGFLLGGAVGAGTVLFALSIGPIMQFAVRLFETGQEATAADGSR